MKREIILHLFNRKLLDIIPLLQLVKDQGFTAIQVGPLQPCKKTGYWWGYYQILGFRIGNKLGTADDFKQLCTKAHNIGLKVFCDYVCNHIAGKENGELLPYDEVDEIIKSNPFFFKEKRMINDWNNRYEVTTYCCGLPTLRLDNYDLQDIIIANLNEFIDLGCDGFRFDSAKNINLPDEGSDFWIRVLGSLHNKENLYNYAEIIFENPWLINKYLPYVRVLTNSTGREKENIVTFFMSHDTELEFKCTNKLDDNTIKNEWESLLSNNRLSGMLFYERYSEEEVNEKIITKFSDLWMDPKIKEINLKYN